MDEKIARAELRHARISARKVKIVIDLIRGKKVKEAGRIQGVKIKRIHTSLPVGKVIKEKM